MKKVHYSGKLKQLKIQIYRLNDLLGKAGNVSLNTIIEIRNKILHLLDKLRYYISIPELKKIAGAALILSSSLISKSANAQSFEAPQENPFGLVPTNEIAFPSFVDLDNDGDFDLLVGEADQDIFDYYVGNFQYYENVGSNTSPDYAAPDENPFWLFPTYVFACPTTVDLDSDGDMDVFAGEAGGDMIYIENVGTPSEPDFWAPEENPFGLSSVEFIATPSFADLDNDGDLDLIVGEYYYDYDYYEAKGRFQYFENTGTAFIPQFADAVANPFGLVDVGPVAAPCFVDLDNDGDYDLIAGEFFLNFQTNSEEGRFKYFENIGSPEEAEFADPIINPFGLESLFYYAFPSFADLDNDGDLDLIAGEYQGSMHYFENTDIVGLKEISSPNSIKIYPNPFNDILFLESEIEIALIEVIDLLGKHIPIEYTAPNQLSLSHLKSGLYTLRIQLENEQIIVKRIVKN